MPETKPQHIEENIESDNGKETVSLECFDDTDLKQEYLTLVHRYKEHADAEKLAKLSKTALRDRALEIMESVGVDSIVCRDGENNVTSTIVRPEPSSKVDISLLQYNLGTIGGLDSKTIRRIFEVSTPEPTPRNPYIKITHTHTKTRE
jgi:hypothetical protein